MDFQKTIVLKEEVCSVLDKCCNTKGYAYRLGYLDEALGEAQVIYKRKMYLAQGYSGEVRVQSGAMAHPCQEMCTAVVILYHLDNELAREEFPTAFTGTHILKFEDFTFTLHIVY